MPVRAACPNPDCRRSYNLADGLATPTARCPACRSVLTYPDTAASLGETVSTPESAPAPEPVPVAPIETGTVPQRVGRFIVLGKLGSGAFGTVYKARDPHLERDVALKVPNPGMLDTPKRVERFLREAKAAAQLRHPNIVPVYDAGQDGERYYIASAFVDGKPLSDVVGEGGLKVRRAAEIVRLLAEAVGYAHEQGVVHRDIKPHNVMLDAADRPHLMDFGLAVRADEAEKLTNDGAVLGTPAYMAPEQAAGQRATSLSDQYSLGVLLYELLTGGPPFEGPPAAVVYRVIHHDPPAPRTRRPGLPPDLETICLKAMAKRPTDRYAMCKMLADDLRQWLADEPIDARRHTAAERAARWVRRNRTVAALMLLTVGSLAAGTAAVAAFGLQARNRARDAEVARDAAERAEAEATAAREAADAYAAKADRLLNDLVGEQGRGKDREHLIGQLQGEWRTRQEAADRLQAEVARLRARLDGTDGELPPPRPVSARLVAELDDLRAELVRARRDLGRLAARSDPSRPTLYQYAQRLLEDNTPGAADTTAATLARVPVEHRGWEWAYLTHWQRPRNFTGRELRAAGRPVAAQLAPSGDRVFTAVVEGSDLNTLLVVSTASIGGASPQVTNTRLGSAFAESYQIVSNGTAGLTVMRQSPFRNPAGQQRPSVTLRQPRAAQKGERKERKSLWVTDPVFSPATQFVAYRELPEGVNIEGPKPGIGWQTLWPGRDEQEARGGFLDLPAARNPAAISDDGEFLVVDSGAVLSLPDGARVAQFPFPVVGAAVVFSPRATWVAAPREFDPASPVVAVVCAPVRNPAEGTREFVGHTGRVRAIGFSADERRMVSGSEDGTVRVWDTTTAECLLTLRAGGTVAQVVMSADGKRVVALLEDPKDPKAHRVRVWEARPEKKP